VCFFFALDLGSTLHSFRRTYDYENNDWHRGQ